MGRPRMTHRPPPTALGTRRLQVGSQSRSLGEVSTMLLAEQQRSVAVAPQSPDGVPVSLALGRTRRDASGSSPGGEAGRVTPDEAELATEDGGPTAPHRGNEGSASVGSSTAAPVPVGVGGGGLVEAEAPPVGILNGPNRIAAGGQAEGEGPVGGVSVGAAAALRCGTVGGSAVGSVVGGVVAAGGEETGMRGKRSDEDEGGNRGGRGDLGEGVQPRPRVRPSATHTRSVTWDGSGSPRSPS